MPTRCLRTAAALSTSLEATSRACVRSMRGTCSMQHAPRVQCMHTVPAHSACTAVHMQSRLLRLEPLTPRRGAPLDVSAQLAAVVRTQRRAMLHVQRHAAHHLAPGRF